MSRGKASTEHTKLWGPLIRDDFLITRTTAIQDSGLVVLSTARKWESLPQRDDLVTLSLLLIQKEDAQQRVPDAFSPQGSLETGQN